MRDKRLPELDDDLFFSIEEKNHKRRSDREGPRRPLAE